MEVSSFMIENFGPFLFNMLFQFDSYARKNGQQHWLVFNILVPPFRDGNSQLLRNYIQYLNKFLVPGLVLSKQYIGLKLICEAIISSQILMFYVPKIVKKISSWEFCFFTDLSSSVIQFLPKINVPSLISPKCLHSAFTCADPKRAKRHSRPQCLFCAFGICACKKAARKTLVKLTPYVKEAIKMGSLNLFRI